MQPVMPQKKFDSALGKIAVERDGDRNRADFQRGINMESRPPKRWQRSASIDLGDEPLLRRDATELQHSREENSIARGCGTAG